MKKIFLILLVFISCKSFAQTDTALGTNGRKLPIHKLSLLHPFQVINDSTATFDSARYYMATFGYNGTNDSLVITFLDGTRFAVAKPSGSGGTDTSWEIINTNDIRNKNSGNVGIGTGVSYPIAKLQINTTSVSTASPDSSKGILITTNDVLTTGQYSNSGAVTWVGKSYNADVNKQNIKIHTYVVPYSTTGEGYLTFGYAKAGTSTFTDGLLNIGRSAGGSNWAVGIGGLPSNAPGSILNVYGGINQVSGSYTVPGTWNINAFGNKFIDLNQSSAKLTFLPSPITWNKIMTPAPFAFGKETDPTLGAQVDIDNPGRATLISRGTMTQRDSINLTITGLTVVNGGTGYTGLGPSVTASAGPIPSTLTTASFSSVLWNISGGALTSSLGFSGYPGSYNSTPTITLSGGGGTGAVVRPVMIQVLTAGMTYYCTDCTATDSSTGVLQVWNGSTWKNAW